MRHLHRVFSIIKPCIIAQWKSDYVIELARIPLCFLLERILNYSEIIKISYSSIIWARFEPKYKTKANIKRLPASESFFHGNSQQVAESSSAHHIGVIFGQFAREYWQRWPTEKSAAAGMRKLRVSRYHGLLIPTNGMSADNWESESPLVSIHTVEQKKKKNSRQALFSLAPQFDVQG